MADELTVTQTEEVLAKCSPADALNLLKAELARKDGPRAGVLVAIGQKHGAAIAALAEKGTNNKPLNDLGKLEIIGDIPVRSNLIVFGDAQSFDVVWNRRSLGEWAVYVKPQPALADKAITRTLQAWDAEKLADGTLRIMCGTKPVANQRMNNLLERIKRAKGELKGTVEVAAVNASSVYVRDLVREKGTAYVNENGGFSFGGQAVPEGTKRVRVSRTSDGRIVIG